MAFLSVTGVVLEGCWAHGDAMLGEYCYAGPRGDTGPWGDAATLGLEEMLDLGGDTAVLLRCYAAVLVEMRDLGVLLHCYAATLGSSRRHWDLGVLLHCYAGGPRGDAGTSGILLRWGPRWTSG